MSAENAVVWRAPWIWCAGEPAPFHFFLFLRRRFQLHGKPRQALFHITAADRYRLFVNGTYLGRGPQRGDPRWQTYDSYDLTALLNKGENTIAVQAYHYGCLTGFTRESRAGLSAQLEVTLRDGKKETVVTNHQWKARPAQGWRRDVAQVPVTGVPEIYDASQDPPDWMRPDFDDSPWAGAVVLPHQNLPWSVPTPRDIPMIVEEERFPESVVRTGETLELGGIETTDIPGLLSRDVEEPLCHAHVKNPKALLTNDDTVAEVQCTHYTLHDDANAGIRDPFMLIDFGRQVNGFPRIRLDAPARGIVDLAYAEELIGGRIVPATAARGITGTYLGDRYITREGHQEWESFEYKSFRYLKVTFRNFSRPARVRSISVNTWTYPAEQRGRFECSDPLLTKLWAACIATTRLCTDDAYMDTPFREKRNFVGDVGHGLLGTYAAFGNIALVRRHFRLAAQGQMEDGMLRNFFPGGDLFGRIGPKSINFIPQGALTWTPRIYEHFQHFGDRSVLEEMYPTLVRIVDWCRRHADENGLLANLPGRAWLDWTPTDLRGANFATNAFCLWTLEDMAHMAGELRLGKDAATWKARAERVRGQLRTRFWDEGRGLFMDSLYKGRLTGIASELGNSLAILLGLASPAQINRIVPQLIVNHNEMAPASPLFIHYVALALSRASRTDAMLEMLRTRFKPMMARCDTISEDWTPHTRLNPITEETPGVPDVIPDGQLSSPWADRAPHYGPVAHIGGVGVAWVLSAEVFGIRPSEPGFRKCLLTPQLGLFERASGVFPADCGDISVSWHREGVRTVLDVVLPEGLQAELRLPRDGSREQTMSHNGHRFKIPAAGPLPTPLQELDNTMAFPLLGGTHCVILA